VYMTMRITDLNMIILNGVRKNETSYYW